MTRLTASVFCLVVVCTLVPIPAPAGQQSPPEVAGARKFYEELIRTPIVPQRSSEDIEHDVTAAEQEMQQADKAIANSQARVKEAEGWLATQKREMDGLKANIDVAKKEKREADKLALEGQQKQLELVDEYLKKTKAVRDAELDLAKAQKDLVGAGLKVYQAESDLRKKTEDIKNAGPQDPNITKIALDAAQAGENTLKLMKIVADKNQDVAGRLARVADRRIDLAQSRNKLMSEDRIRQAAASMKK